MQPSILRLDLRPVRRSRFRLAIGKCWFRMRRYAQWLTSDMKLAGQRQTSSLAHPVFSHSAPLYRKLRDIDMRLQTNKVVNLKLAASRLDGLLLRPGETFSYWRTIGKPTSRKGYVEGMVLFYGTYRTGVGSG